MRLFSFPPTNQSFLFPICLIPPGVNKTDPLGGNKCNNRGIKHDTMISLVIEAIHEKHHEISSELIKFEEETEANDIKSIKINKIQEQINKSKKALNILQIQLEEELINISSFTLGAYQIILFMNDISS